MFSDFFLKGLPPVSNFKFNNNKKYVHTSYVYVFVKNGRKILIFFQSVAIRLKYY